MGISKLVVIGAIAAVSACKFSKETVPVNRAESAIRVPNQQRVVALATDQAVEALDLSALQGKSVGIELQGVFPHTDQELLGYVRAQVEAKLARSGARVIAQPAVLIVPGASATAAAPTTGTTQGALALSDPPDFRLLVNVSWGGADIREKVTTDEPLLTKQIGLAATGLIGGVLLFQQSDSTFRKTFSALGVVVTVGGAALWYMKKSPFPRVTTLIGRVRIVAQGVPTRDGTAFTTEGSGESKIINDERIPEGYMVVR